ncbi:MAG: twin-arginine translocation signal domain-containing protein, partial [Mesorhizobium sp.]
MRSKGSEERRRSLLRFGLRLFALRACDHASPGGRDAKRASCRRPAFRFFARRRFDDAATPKALRDRLSARDPCGSCAPLSADQAFRVTNVRAFEMQQISRRQFLASTAAAGVAGAASSLTGFPG